MFERNRPAQGLNYDMKRSIVVVPWPEGLHLRPAARLVEIGHMFSSTVLLKCGDKIADLRSILSILTLCATLGTALEIEASGIDEEIAAQAVEEVFEMTEGVDPPSRERQEHPL